MSMFARFSGMSAAKRWTLIALTAAAVVGLIFLVGFVAYKLDPTPMALRSWPKGSERTVASVAYDWALEKATAEFDLTAEELETLGSTEIPEFYANPGNLTDGVHQAIAIRARLYRILTAEVAKIRGNSPEGMDAWWGTQLTKSMLDVVEAGAACDAARELGRGGQRERVQYVQSGDMNLQMQIDRVVGQDLLGRKRAYLAASILQAFDGNTDQPDKNALAQELANHGPGQYGFQNFLRPSFALANALDAINSGDVAYVAAACDDLQVAYAEIAPDRMGRVENWLELIRQGWQTAI